jgi:hypothetical protein
VKQDELKVEIAFSSDDFNQLKAFCNETQLKFFKRPVNKIKEHFFIENSLSEWVAILKQSFVHCDNLLRTLRKFAKKEDASGINLVSGEWLISIYEILLEKLEQLKPHLSEPLKELHCLETTGLSQWDYSKDLFHGV